MVPLPHVADQLNGDLGYFSRIEFAARWIKYAEGEVGEGPFSPVPDSEWTGSHVAIAIVAPDVCKCSTL